MTARNHEKCKHCFSICFLQKNQAHHAKGHYKKLFHKNTPNCPRSDFFDMLAKLLLFKFHSPYRTLRRKCIRHHHSAENFLTGECIFFAAQCPTNSIDCIFRNVKEPPAGLRFSWQTGVGLDYILNYFTYSGRTYTFIEAITAVHILNVNLEFIKAASLTYIIICYTQGKASILKLPY